MQVDCDVKMMCFSAGSVELGLFYDPVNTVKVMLSWSVILLTPSLVFVHTISPVNDNCPL